MVVAKFNYEKLLPVLICLNITPALFAQYTQESINIGNTGKRFTLFFGFLSIASFLTFIYVSLKKNPENEGSWSWFLLLIAFVFGYFAYTTQIGFLD